MKRGFLIILALSMIIALLGGCGYDPETLIALGDSALEQREYEKALDYYRQAGSAGTEKRRNLLISRAKSKNTSSENYDKMLEYLLEEASDLISEEEAYTILVDDLNQELQEILTEIEAASSLDEKEVRFYNSTIREMCDSATDVIPDSIPGLKEAISTANNAKAEVTLKSYGPDYDYINWEYIMDDWIQCTDGKGFEVMEAQKTIRKGEYIEGLQSLNDLLGNSLLAESLYQEITANANFKTISQILSSTGAPRKLNPQDQNQTMKNAFENQTKLSAGTSSLDTSITLSVSMLDDLKSKCGQSPNGKVLILHTMTNKVDIALSLMEYLPDNRYPYDLESIEYVIVLNAESVETGATYDCGTKQIREDVILELYRAESGKLITTLKAIGPTSYVISYYGDPPKYYSAGPANISEEMLSICGIIDELT